MLINLQHTVRIVNEGLDKETKLAVFSTLYITVQVMAGNTTDSVFFGIKLQKTRSGGFLAASIIDNPL